nr:unnamed protein product [Callosobruchus analis]
MQVVAGCSWSLLSRAVSSLLLVININNNMSWHDNIVTVTKTAVQKLGVVVYRRASTPTLQYVYPVKLFPFVKLCTPELLLLYNAQIRPSLVYCSHVWGCAPKYSLKLPDSIEDRTVRQIGTPIATKNFHILEHRGRVADLSLFYRFYYGRYSSELLPTITPKDVRMWRSVLLEQVSSSSPSFGGMGCRGETIESGEISMSSEATVENTESQDLYGIKQNLDFTECSSKRKGKRQKKGHLNLQAKEIVLNVFKSEFLENPGISIHEIEKIVAKKTGVSARTMFSIRKGYKGSHTLSEPRNPAESVIYYDPTAERCPNFITIHAAVAEITRLEKSDRQTDRRK